jgi:hypothetical protein
MFIVGLDMTEADPAQLFDRYDGRHRFGDQREHAARAGVKQHRLVSQNQELAEAEAFGPDIGHEGRDAMDAGGDFVNAGGHTQKAFRPRWVRSFQTERSKKQRHFAVRTRNTGRF